MTPRRLRALFWVVTVVIILSAPTWVRACLAVTVVAVGLGVGLANLGRAPKLRKRR